MNKFIKALQEELKEYKEQLEQITTKSRPIHFIDIVVPQLDKIKRGLQLRIEQLDEIETEKYCGFCGAPKVIDEKEEKDFPDYELDNIDDSWPDNPFCYICGDYPCICGTDILNATDFLAKV